MARGRMVSKTLGSSRRFKQLEISKHGLSEFAQVLFVLILSHADDFGRQDGDAFTIKHRVFPVSDRSEKDFAKALKLLHDVGLIAWYQIEGKHIIEVANFSDHQVGLHKRTASKFPDPPTRRTRRDPRAVTASVTPKEDVVEGRAREMMQYYIEEYSKVRKQPYLQHRLQEEKDFGEAKILCMAYNDDDLKRMITQFLGISDKHPSLKGLVSGKQRTLPMFSLVAGSIATQLDIQGVVA